MTKLYTVNLADNNGVITPLAVDLHTAKGLAQIFADKIRSSEHRRRKPLKWVRLHSDRIVEWVGFIDLKSYATLHACN